MILRGQCIKVEKLQGEFPQNDGTKKAWAYEQLLVLDASDSTLHKVRLPSEVDLAGLPYKAGDTIEVQVSVALYFGKLKVTLVPEPAMAGR